MIEIKCLQCEKPVWTYPSKGRKYCSNRCKGEAKRGENNPHWKERVELECLQCGKKFKVKPSRKDRIYCSEKCYGESKRKEKIPCICHQCGKKFEVYPCRVKRGKVRYCSNKCKNEVQCEAQRGENNPYWHGGMVEIKCLWCEKTFKVILSRKSIAKYCSDKCSIEALRGEGSPHWRGGKSFEPYGVEFNRALRRAVRDRDGHVCQECGEPEGKEALDVHHIDYDKQNNDIDNLVALCRSCHSKTNANRDYWQPRLRAIVAWRGKEIPKGGVCKSPLGGTSIDRNQVPELRAYGQSGSQSNTAINSVGAKMERIFCRAGMRSPARMPRMRRANEALAG